LDRNELGALLLQAGLGTPRDHALSALLALNGLRISEALGADVTDLGVERGHRTLRIVRKGGKHVTIPLAPLTVRRWTCISVSNRRPCVPHRRRPWFEPRCRGPASTPESLARRQEAASHADPRTTMRYDCGRQSLDGHATYVVAAFLAGVASLNVR
jgi:integrase